MKKISKKVLATLLTVISITVFMFPLQVFAQAGTLATETPYITATFKNSDGKSVDGNELESGDYTVSIKLSGMKTVSIFQLTAAYTDDLTVNSVATIADNDASFSEGALVNEDNTLIAIIVSENDDTSAVTDGEVMLTMSVTVNTPGDFADYFIVSSDPDLTFIEADYGDGYEAAYVLIGNEETDTAFPYITVDMSPILGADTYSVTGQITIASDINGIGGEVGIAGITVSVDVNGETISAVSDSGGYYTLTGLPAGTYAMLISGPTTIDREVTLIVTEDKSVEAIPIAIADYNKDGYIDNTDMYLFLLIYNGGEEAYDINYDYNGDGYVDNTDKYLFSVFYDEVVEYINLSI